MQPVRKFYYIFLTVMILSACAQPPQQTSTLPPSPMVVASPTVAHSQIPTESALPATEEISAPPTMSAPAKPPAVTPTTVVPLDPDCAVGQPPTRADMEGPYFLAGSPEKISLIEPGMSGAHLMINGSVMTVDCQPIPGTKLEFWQADADGVYDLQGYRLRGHTITDENGRYQIQTIIPAPYEPRPRHIHVMVLPPGQPGLTTQLYFPGDSPYPELTLELSEDAQEATAIFNFVLATK